MNATLTQPAMFPDYSHFAAINALVDAGWLKRLKAVELAVLIIYIRHADGSTGVAHPGSRRIADALGHNDTRHVRAARSQLVKLGLLVRMPGGGGRDAGRYRVVVVVLTQARIRPRAESDLGPNQAPPLGPNPAYPPGPNPAGLLGPNRSTEQLIEQPIEQHTEQPKGRGRKAKPAVTVEIPTTLDTPDFRRAWCDWEKYRHAKGKTLIPMTSVRQLEGLAAMGVVAAIARLDSAIANGWTGCIFPSDRDNRTPERSKGHANAGRRREIVEHLTL